MIRNNIAAISQRIIMAADKSGRNPESIRLVAVTKTVAAERIREAVQAGVKIIGENYIQEARQKSEVLTSMDVSSHFIGHLQTNKAKYAVRMFDLIQSVDSEKLAQELNRQAGRLNKIQHILIQVNIGEEDSKAGILLQHTITLLSAMEAFHNLSVTGLMIIPPYSEQPEDSRVYFSMLRRFRDRLEHEYTFPANVSLKELSMGMSHDFEIAIEEGASMVRIGTAIFGARH